MRFVLVAQAFPHITEVLLAAQFKISAARDYRDPCRRWLGWGYRISRHEPSKLAKITQ